MVRCPTDPNCNLPIRLESRPMTVSRGRGWGAALLVAGALAPVSDALALLGDRLEVFAAETITYDSNLIRIAKGINTFNAIGNSSRADTYLTTSVGVNANFLVGRQRFVGGY